MFTLIVGDTTDYLSKYSATLDKNSLLITNSNYSNVLLDNAHKTYYTSVGDLNEQFISNLLDVADKVIYNPPITWTSISIQELTERLLLISNTRNNNVVNLPIYDTTDIVKLIPASYERISTTQQIWTMGDSNTYPIGVSREESYSYKLSRLIGLPYTNLSISASSNILQASIILRSDLRRGDSVFWGLSTIHRETLAINGKLNYISINDQLNHVSVSSYLNDTTINNILPLELVDSKQYLFKTLMAVMDVIEVCSKLGVLLFMGGIKVEEEFCKYFSKFNNYIHLYNSHIGHKDYASDGDHPGPLTHTWYAEQFYKKYLNNI